MMFLVWRGRASTKMGFHLSKMDRLAARRFEYES